VQLVPQSIPAGLDVSLATPAPLIATLRVLWSANWAVTDFAVLMLSEQVFATEVQAPAQPLNTPPLVAFAVRVTVDRAGKAAVQLTAKTSGKPLTVSVSTAADRC
jgi:hypothetical protein